jgi:hypothetical protein
MVDDENTTTTATTDTGDGQEFTRFETLTRDLLKVSKSELDDKRGTRTGAVNKTGTA